MKRFTRLFAALAIAVFAATMAHAQEAVPTSTSGDGERTTAKRNYHPYPYGFISVQGGGQVTFTNYDASKLITPVGAFSVGGFFTPSVGVRLHANGWRNKGAIRQLGKEYEYNYATGNLDVMLNLTNAFCHKHESHILNVILLGGFGLSYAWDNDDLKKIQAENNLYLPLAWEDNRLTHNFRVGLMFEGNLCKHLGVNLEVSANNLHDRFNSKQNGRGDWQLTAMLGLTYKFGFKKRAVEAPKPIPVVEQPQEVPVAPVIVEEPAPEPKVEEVVEKKLEELSTNIFFALNSSTIAPEEEAKVKGLAEWLKAHPTATVDITGYADVETGNPKINMELSKKRADAVVALLGKEGISSDRMVVAMKGDTEQPLTPNERNRVVITYAKEKE